MADNVLGSVRIEISGDYSRLEVDFKSAEKAAQTAGAKIASSMTVSMQSSASTTDQFSAAIDRLIAAQARENAALALSIQRNAAMQGALRTTSSGLQSVGKAATEAGGKVQSFVGLIPGLGRAAEQFINLIPGLGRGIMTIFPVLGFVALAESVGRIAGNVYDLAKAWDPVLSAEKRATEQAEKFSQEIATVRKHLQAMADAKFGDMFGQSAMQAAQAAAKGMELVLLQGQLLMMQAKAANPNAGTAGAVGAGVAMASGIVPGLKPLADRFARGNKIDAATATQDVVLLQSKIREVEAEQRALSRKSIETHLNDQVDVRDKAAAAAERAQKKENEGWENRYELFEKSLKEVQAARDKDLEDEKHYTDAMAEQQQRWVKINLDAKDERLKQAKIDVPVESRVAPNLEIGMALKRSGIGTTQVRESQIAEDQRLLNMEQAVNVPLGTQLKMREQILQEQIALKEEQGQSVSQELQALDALQAQMDRMRQKAQGIAPLLHNLRGIGGQIPGQLGGALAHGITSGNPGKEIGKEIRQALQGVGQQMLGTIFTGAIQRLVESLGLNTLANSVLQALFGVQQGTTAGLIASQTANTAAVVANTTALGAHAATGAAGAAAGVAGKVAGGIGNAASGGILGGVISGVISAAGSLVGAFLIIRAIHGTTAEVRALRRSGIKTGGDGLSGSSSDKPAQEGYIHSLAKIFGADAVRVNIVAISPLALSNGVFGLIGNLFGFADGGRPPTNRPSWVGERGKELFVPDQAGTIIPNHMLMGGAGLSFPSAASSGGGINIGSITAHGVNNPRDFIREVARQLPAYLKSTNPKYSPAAR